MHIFHSAVLCLLVASACGGDDPTPVEPDAPPVLDPDAALADPDAMVAEPDASPTDAPAPFCGDGTVSPPEFCDDGDTDPEDGCNADCGIEPGFVCTGTAPSVCEPVCGDGLSVGGEECDDLNDTAGDGCAGCVVEAGWTCIMVPSVCSSTCGDGAVAVGPEECDDGGLAPGDGCDADCGAEVFPYAEDFDDGAHELTTASNSTLVYWHLSTFAAASAPNSLRLADPVLGGYDDGALDIGATATTPFFPVPAGGARLDYNLRKSTEAGNSYDVLHLELLDATGAMIATDLVTINTGTSFVAHTFSVSPAFAGQYVQLRFRFQTGDGVVNSDAGVFLDDLLTVVPACGDAFADTTAGETCDDGNAVENDGCNSACAKSCFATSTPGAMTTDSGTCYGVFTAMTDWTTAEANCVAEAGHLATISSSTENDLVRDLFLGAGGQEPWIGFNDVATEGNWIWSSGEAVPYTQWNGGEPNDTGGAEDCGMMYTSGNWNDGSCAEARRYVCEVNAPSSCAQALARVPGSPSGIYWIAPITGGAATQVYCDMTTDGGGWMLALAYNHPGGANDPIAPGVAPLDPDTGYSHMGNAQLSGFIGMTEARFYCETSAHARVLHFRINDPMALTYLRTGSMNSVTNWTGGGVTTYADHTAFLPLTTDGVFTGQGDLAMTNFPFYDTSTSHWGIQGGGNRWECDDFADDASQTTQHRVWVR